MSKTLRNALATIALLALTSIVLSVIVTLPLPVARVIVITAAALCSANIIRTMHKRSTGVRCEYTNRRGARCTHAARYCEYDAVTQHYVCKRHRTPGLWQRPAFSNARTLRLATQPLRQFRKAS